MFERPELPDKDDPEYIDALVDACILAFKKFGDDGMALNYMGVSGKLRPIVMENEKYKLETRQAQAEKFLEEIEDIEQISKALKTDAPKESVYDPRNPGKVDPDQYAKDIKENISLRLKVADIRREMLSITKAESQEEVDALHIFFVPVTAAEFAALKSVEVHDGSDTTDMEDKSDSEKIVRSHGDLSDNEASLFITGADGSLEEIVE